MRPTLDFGPLWALGFITGIVLLFAWLWYLIAEEEKRWQTFKSEHACVISAKVPNHVAQNLSIDHKGDPVVGMVTIAGQTGWTCDDGVTYYR